MNIVLYTIDCPKCKILEKMLNSKNIEFIKSYDVDYMIQKGFKMLPMLSVDENIMDFSEAVKWIKNKN